MYFSLSSSYKPPLDAYFGVFNGLGSGITKRLLPVRLILLVVSCEEGNL